MRWMKLEWAKAWCASMTSRCRSLVWGRRACVSCPHGGVASKPSCPCPPHRLCLVSSCLPSNEPHDTRDRICCHITGLCLYFLNSTVFIFTAGFRLMLVDKKPVLVLRIVLTEQVMRGPGEILRPRKRKKWMNSWVSDGEINPIENSIY